jgi:hypothetical protein
LGTFVSTAFRAYFKDAKREKLKIYRVAGYLASPEAGRLLYFTTEATEESERFFSRKVFRERCRFADCLGTFVSTAFRAYFKDAKREKVKAFLVAGYLASPEAAI